MLNVCAIGLASLIASAAFAQDTLIAFPADLIFREVTPELIAQYGLREGEFCDRENPYSDCEYLNDDGLYVLAFEGLVAKVGVGGEVCHYRLDTVPLCGEGTDVIDAIGERWPAVETRYFEVENGETGYFFSSQSISGHAAEEFELCAFVLIVTDSQVAGFELACHVT